MAVTNAHRQRALRQDALREWLSEKCTAQHLVDNLHKIESLEPESETFANELKKYQVANEQRLKIMNKYIPDLKLQEVTGPDGGAIEYDHSVVIEFVGIEDPDS